MQEGDGTLLDSLEKVLIDEIASVCNLMCEWAYESEQEPTYSSYTRNGCCPWHVSFAIMATTEGRM